MHVLNSNELPDLCDLRKLQEIAINHGQRATAARYAPYIAVLLANDIARHIVNFARVKAPGLTYDANGNHYTLLMTIGNAGASERFTLNDLYDYLATDHLSRAIAAKMLRKAFDLNASRPIDVPLHLYGAHWPEDIMPDSHTALLGDLN